MNITPSEFQYVKEQKLTQMIQLLCEEQHLPLEEAMGKVYSSELFEKLSEPSTGLFTQSARYLLSYITDQPGTTPVI